MANIRKISTNTFGENATIFQGDVTNGLSNADILFLERISQTDPFYDRKRILKLKGPLLHESSSWILDQEDFKEWRNTKESGVLWINGDPGKGKTMLLCGIIDDLEKNPGRNANLGYFFCQATDIRINSAAAVLAGLIVSLIKRHQALLLFIRQLYENRLSRLGGTNTWRLLCDIFETVIRDSNSPDPVCVVDALDECERDNRLLLNLIAKTSSRVKWLLSSRNVKETEQGLRTIDSSQRIILELKENAECVSQAVDVYVNTSVRDIKALEDDEELRLDITRFLNVAARGNFLWVSLVVEQLRDTDRQYVRDQLFSLPHSLEDMYGLIMEQCTWRLRKEDQDTCQILLSIVTTAERPLRLEELLEFIRFQRRDYKGRYDVRDIKDTVKHCGSFLSITDGTVYFFHQSVKDYMVKESDERIFPLGIKYQHSEMFKNSLYAMSRVLKHDIYNLKTPERKMPDISPPDLNPLAPIAYCCIFWVEHLLHSCQSREDIYENFLQDNGTLHCFLRDFFLYWLESLALLKSLVPQGVEAVEKLQNITERYYKSDNSQNHDDEMIYTQISKGAIGLRTFVDDALQFIRNCKDYVREQPLQLYHSAFLFLDSDNAINKTFHCIIHARFENLPTFLNMPRRQYTHLHMIKPDESVEMLLYSPNSSLLLLSLGATVSLWRTDTGILKSKIKLSLDERGRQTNARYIAFSSDSRQLVFVSRTGVIQIWDVDSGVQMQEYSLHLDVNQREEVIALSQNGDLVASTRCVSDRVSLVKVWTKVGDCVYEINHTPNVLYANFSPDSTLLALMDEAGVEIYSAQTGENVQHLPSNTPGQLEYRAHSKFSPNSELFASIHKENDIYFWHTKTWTIIHQIGKSASFPDPFTINHFEFSPDSAFFIVSSEKSLLFGSTATGQCLLSIPTTGTIKCVRFSPDWANSSLLVSADYNEVVMWRINAGDILASREQFSDSGYASMPQNIFKEAQSVQLKTVTQELHNIITESDPYASSLLEETASLGIEQADDRTEYSLATSLGNSKIKDFVSELADQLIREKYIDGLDERSMEAFCAVLKEILKTFALKIGFDAKSQIQRDIMYYTHKYSEDIVDSFRETWLYDRERDNGDFLRSGDDRIAPEITQEMTKDWVNNSSGFEDYEIPTIEAVIAEDVEEDCLQEYHIGQDFEENGEESLSGLNAYHDFISTSPAYDWLLAILRRQSLMEIECSRSMKDIEQTIVSSLPWRHKISKSRPAEAFQMTFLIDWDPITFLQEQHYKESLNEAIERAITLTGSTRNAQALTTLQYLRQTWPTTGEHVLQLVKDVFGGCRGQKYTRYLPEGIELTAWTTNTEFITEVSGTRASIAEIGEQLAWLSTSLRSSLNDTGITLYTPSVHIIRSDHAEMQVSNSKVHCRIEFIGEKEQDNSFANGQCWHNMFRNPILVEGFPIPRRPKSDTGLEIPLNMMAALANTRRLDEFNGKIFIKGFSTMLIPTDSIGGAIIWHLQYRHDGDYISYLDACVPHITISVSELEQSRNIVGWCSQADLLAGAKEASYNVRRSGLPRPTADCILHNVSISAGKIVTGGASLAIGFKDKPIHIARDGYIPRLEWIHKRFIVLWDEKYKRGWLVNGTTALLHLLRAVLKRKQEGPFKSSLLFESGSMAEATERLTAESAIQVLTHESNMKLKIYRDKSQYNETTIWRGTDRQEVIHEEKENFYRFQDLVDDLYNILNKMVEHQVNAASKSGVSLKCRLRKHLDGWEFDDIIENKDCHPSVATLEAMGNGWVDLITEIGAVILLGKDFGEIIQPSASEVLCDRWSQMPRDRYYLGACLSDLTNIIHSHGENGAEHLRITNNISWHNSDKRFEPCRCNKTGPSYHSDLVQELRQSKDYSIMSSSSKPLKAHGAVIFSHNIKLKGRWVDAGMSTKAKPSGSLEASESFYRDSALSSSQVQSISESSNNSSGLNSRQSPPVFGSITSGPCDSEDVRSQESQTEASIGGSLANIKGHDISESQVPPYVVREELPDSLTFYTQDIEALGGQGSSSVDSRQVKKRGRKLIKQLFAKFFRK